MTSSREHMPLDTYIVRVYFVLLWLCNQIFQDCFTGRRWGNHTLQLRHIERDDISNHLGHDCLRNRLLRRRWKKTSKPRVSGLCDGNSSVTGGFPSQRASKQSRRRRAYHDVTVMVWGNWTHDVQTEATSPATSCPACRGFVQHLVKDSNEGNVKYLYLCPFLRRILPRDRRIALTKCQ